MRQKSVQFLIPSVTTVSVCAVCICSVILKVMGWNQYIVNKPALTGVHQLELRLLAKMGYEVFVVNINL